ncbi:MAG: SDR family oxidoreductase [Burkholderiales bacterium]|nr:SDR family oxidoreductase [Burkholderiales bacterium]
MTVLITGASGAIGQALARRLARRGERVLLTGRDTLRLEALASELGAAWLSPDLTTEEGLAKLTAWAEAQGPADALAHCVGSTVVRPLHLTSLSDWRSQFEVNATTAFTLLKWLVAGALKAQRPARAVLVSSVVAEAGFANHEAIAAAKAAVTALALSTAATYAERGIRVNVVAPGLTRSPLTQRFIATPEAEARSAALIPSGRIGEPHEVAAAIDFLLLPEADHINGQVLRVDGGQAVLRPLPKTPAKAP